jgi:hypothetical protein
MKDLSLKEYEQLSAYLDGQLSPAEARRVEAQLSRYAEWRQALDELSATRALLQRAPHYHAPRNFTLAPELATQYARKPWFASLASFRLSSAVAALAVLAMMLIQLLPGGAVSAPSAAPIAEMQAATEPNLAASLADDSPKTLDAQPPESTQAAAESTPAIILWGNNSGFLASGQALGRGGGSGGGGPDTFTNSEGIVAYGDQKLSPGAANSAPNLGGGIVTYDGQAAPDANSANLLPEASVAEAPAAAEDSAASNLILGLPSSDQAGQIIAEAPISAAPSSEALSQQQSSTLRTATSPSSFWTSTRMTQAGLLVLALLAGGFAVFTRRRVS